jgi:hypothetical protein
MVTVHGGPTGVSRPAYNISHLYWTSRGFAVFDANYLMTVGRMHHHEPASTDVPGRGPGDGEREFDRDGGIHAVSAGLQYFEAHSRRRWADADDHAVAAFCLAKSLVILARERTP